MTEGEDGFAKLTLVRSGDTSGATVVTVTTADGSAIGIRTLVDALCRDGRSEISRDPRTKRLQTRRESLARPS